MSRFRRSLSFVAGIFTLTILLLIVNNSLFTHTHTLQNGQIVVHAHPFQKSNSSNSIPINHQHTKVEFSFIDLLSSLNFLISFGVILLFTQQLYNLKTHNFISFQILRIVSKNVYRGPPISFI